MVTMILDEDANTSEVQSNNPMRTTKRKNTSPSQQARSPLSSTTLEEELDLIVVGFGPAALAIAIALHDKLKCYTPWRPPKVLFLEKQAKFAWHAGMQLPAAKMQISFIKDLATLRDPCSKFTFLNYLKEHDRLVHFSNLGTFLPSRLEFEDYMRWCASHFTHIVQYGQEVLKITPSKSQEENEKPNHFVVEMRDQNGKSATRRTKNIVVAIGGTPQIPTVFAGSTVRTVHSSGYGQKISQLLPVREKAYNIAVVGGGQSGAEVFNDLHTRYPAANTRLIIRDTFLRPSDDSPFVNEIFNPGAVSTFYSQPSSNRYSTLNSNKNTNYSVVRLELLDHIYNTIYQQSIEQPERHSQQHQILPCREITEATDRPSNKRIDLKIKVMDPASSKVKEVLAFDAVILATGYTRDAHLGMLKECQVLNASKDGAWEVGRDYKVKLDEELAGKDIGIWLQGCNEDTHGLSDSLLSILATRSGDLVDSIFGTREGVQ